MLISGWNSWIAVAMLSPGSSPGRKTEKPKFPKSKKPWPCSPQGAGPETPSHGFRSFFVCCLQDPEHPAFLLIARNGIPPARVSSDLQAFCRPFSGAAAKICLVMSGRRD